jgi:aldehyde dehydrogenase (NAD+)
MDPRKVVCGGTSDRERLFLAPTLMRGVSFSDPVMTEEIFGPLLPVLSYHGLDEAVASVKSRPKPLALYIFTRDGGAADRILSDLSFGGGSVNDTVTYISNSALPFGGVGESGMGKYHGEAGFREFSHVKSILKRSLWFEPSLKYPPYTSFKMKLLRFLME